MQQLEISLDSIGYIYSRQLIDFNVEKSCLNIESLCHYYDVLVESSGNNSKLFQPFHQMITSPSALNHPTTPTISPKREFVKNDERRQYLLDEFIMTEANYLSSLKSFITLIVDPLRQRAKDRQRAIIGQYECANIFMNIYELVTVTQDFYNDLIQYNTSSDINLGDLCLSHMRRFTCYNQFLLGVHNAQIINEKQLKNLNYFHFLEKVINNQSHGNQTVYDYLALPSQRVGRYTMYFKELIKHTTDDHPDLPGLYGSLLKVEEIANMTEEIHTHIMKIFKKLLQAIQYCPESLISFQRRFLCYLDTAEIDLQTMKPIQPITLFLFSDKIMVVKRPSYETDGLDLCGLDQRMYEGSERKDFCIRKEAVAGKMKFIGWASLNDIDMHHNKSLGPDTFTLVSNSLGPLLSTDQTTHRSLEAYFQSDQQKHAFSINEGGNLINREYFETIEKTRSHFIHQFGKAKNNLKQSDELIQSSYCQWNGHHFFANIYPTSRYHKVSNKNEIALFYIEKNTIHIEAILSHCFIAPNMVGFIVPHEKEDNYRFAIRSKCAIGNTKNEDISLLTFQANDSSSQFFGNLLLCDRDLLKASQMTTPRFSIKRKSTTFKLLSSLTHGNLQQRDISLQTTTVRPQSYSEYILGLEETSNTSIYYSTTSSSGSSSIKSQQSAESRLTLQPVASSDELPQKFNLGKLAAESSYTRYFSSSFHPSQTASYDISSTATNRENNTGNSHKLEGRPSAPAMIEPGSSGVSSPNSSISTTNSSRRSSLFLDPRFDVSSPVSDLMIPIATPNNDYHHHLMKYWADSFTKKSSSCKNELLMELNEKNKTVLMLTSLLQKKEQEIDLLKADLDDSVVELGTVCDKFNSELEHVSNMYQFVNEEEMKRKLEMSLLERNQWQLRATELEHQLRLLNNSNQKRSSSRHGASRPSS